MFCPICGSAVADGMAACPNCGAPIAAQAPQQTYQQPTYQQPVYQQPVYQQPMDMNASIAASKGSSAKIFGIISLVLSMGIGFIFAIVGLVLASQSATYSGGVRNHDAQVGFVCSWITIGVDIAMFAFVFLLAIAGELSIVAPALAIAAPLLLI